MNLERVYAGASILWGKGAIAHPIINSTGEYIINCMKYDIGNVVSDADCMKNIWRNFMEKLIHVENNWDGDVDCPEVMGPCCLISEKEVAAAIKGLNIGK